MLTSLGGFILRADIMRNIIKVHLLLLTLAAPTQAALLSFEQAIDFYAPIQSQWEAGGTATSFSDSDTIGGSAGFKWSSSASSGSVEAQWNGLLSIDYENYWHSPGQQDVGFSFQGDENGGWFETLAGASFQFGWFVNFLGESIHDYDMFSASYQLETDKNFSPQLPTKFDLGLFDILLPKFESGTDSTDFLGIGAGFNLVVISASMGIDLVLEQTATLAARAVSGTMIATHRESGDISTQFFSLGSKDTEPMALTLPKPGYWDVFLLNPTLKNTFINDIDIILQGHIYAEVWPFDKTWNWNLASEPMFDASFPLSFQADYQPESFSIYVAPEPEAFMLFIVGMTLLVHRVSRSVS